MIDSVGEVLNENFEIQDALQKVIKDIVNENLKNDPKFLNCSWNILKSDIKDYDDEQSKKFECYEVTVSVFDFKTDKETTVIALIHHKEINYKLDKLLKKYNPFTLKEYGN